MDQLTWPLSKPFLEPGITLEKPIMTTYKIFTYFDGRVRIVVGDICTQETDAIVNAANPLLRPGGGVCGAIHEAAGSELAEHCNELREAGYPEGVPAGLAVVTPGFKLPAKNVIHTVGPRFGFHQGIEADLLACCYRESLLLFQHVGGGSIAFPSISTGTYRYPADQAAEVVGRALTLAAKEELLPEELRLVFYKSKDAETFIHAWGLSPDGQRR